MSFYYEIIPIIIAFIRTDKVFHLRSYKKKKNEIWPDKLGNGSVKLPFILVKKKLKVVRKFATEHACFTKESVLR